VASANTMERVLFPGERCRYHQARATPSWAAFPSACCKAGIFLIADFLLTAARHFAVRSRRRAMGRRTEVLALIKSQRPADAAHF